jgi:hypothetical protein
MIAFQLPAPSPDAEKFPDRHDIIGAAASIEGIIDLGHEDPLIVESLVIAGESSGVPRAWMPPVPNRRAMRLPAQARRPRRILPSPCASLTGSSITRSWRTLIERALSK